MNFVFKCPFCGMHKVCQDYDIGKKYECPDCKQKAVIIFQPDSTVQQPAIQLDNEDYEKKYLPQHTSSWNEKFQDIGNEPQNGKSALKQKKTKNFEEWFKIILCVYLAITIICFVIGWNTNIAAFYIAPIILPVLFLILYLIVYSPRVFGTIFGIILLLFLMKACDSRTPEERKRDEIKQMNEYFENQVKKELEKQPSPPIIIIQQNIHVK